MVAGDRRARRVETTGMSGATAINFGVVDQRIISLESAQRDIHAQLSNINNKLELQFKGVTETFSAEVRNINDKLAQAGKPNYGVIAAFAGLAFTLATGGWAFGIDPVNKSLTGLREDIKAMSATIVPRSEHQEKWRAYDLAIGKNAEALETLRQDSMSKTEYEATRLVSRQDTANTIATVRTELKDVRDTLDEQIKEIRAGQVSRGEHMQRWDNEAGQRANLQKQIDELKGAIGGIYNARDVILELRERLDRVERTRPMEKGPEGP